MVRLTEASPLGSNLKDATEPSAIAFNLKIQTVLDIDFPEQSSFVYGTLNKSSFI